MTGSIARLRTANGFGFIATPESPRDYFFHASMVEGAPFEQLQIGQIVRFEVDPWPSDKGPRACRVIVDSAGA